MKTRMSLLVWTAFALCAALVLVAMAWLSRGVLAAEHQRARAEAEREAAEIRADFEERTRLALWRMDAAGAAIMLRENRHAIQPAAATGMPAEVLLRFEVRRGQPFEFPDLDSADLPREEVEARIARFRSLLAAHPLPGGEWQLLNTAAVDSQSQWSAVEKNPPRQTTAPVIAPQSRNAPTVQRDSSSTERAQRARAIDNALDAYNFAPAPAAMDALEDAAPETPPATTAMHPSWLGGELLLIRQITHPGQPAADRLQGVWIDWRALANQLLMEIPDLLPGADLLPAEGPDAVHDPLTLVSFPLRLVRPEIGLPGVAAAVTLGAPLRIAWAGVLSAIAAAALLAAGIMRLSERRASFVSAVTHELRTPLTTFRLYSDLLGKGAVAGEKREHYLRVLSREADRLTHLVENVLAFSRIENRRTRVHPRDTTAEDLIEESRARLEDRLATAGMTLEVKLHPDAATARLRVDTAAVEHILFNLIDNAAKYAAGSTPPVVILETARRGNGLEIQIRDHGPGIPETERRRIFQPFHKTDLAAAESQPGVGLGLALSRRLARSIGGRLDYRSVAHGACFVLGIPIIRDCGGL